MMPADAKDEQKTPQVGKLSIAVIADDFTGAAELAGISLRYGLTVDISLGKLYESSADVFIVCTDSRSMTKEAAMVTTAAIAKDILELKPGLIYKKIDSVLRGYVLDEIIVQMNLSKKTKALVVPANPSLGRTIKNGEYFIHDKKITETGFADDPEFPINNPEVKQMIGGNGVSVLKHTDVLPVTGVIVGEATSAGDISSWAGLQDDNTLLAGAGDFFDALLSARHRPLPAEDFVLSSPHLYVCGTAFAERKNFIQSLHETKRNVVFLPAEIDKKWLETARVILHKEQRLVLAIGEAEETASTLRSNMAKAVRQILDIEPFKEIFIEGGSTAAAILQELNINRLEAVNESQRGVVRMKAGDLYITVKPGSYPLPKEILELY